MADDIDIEQDVIFDLPPHERTTITFRRIGYLCPDCLTWAEDMTPHCFNEHGENDPVPTQAIYTKQEA